MTRHILPLLLILSLSPYSVSGQQAPQRVPGPDLGTIVGYNEYDGPSGVHYSYANLLNCLYVIDGNLFEGDCFGEKMEEDITREEVRGLDRVVRAGALTIGALAAGIEYIKNVIDSSRLLLESVRAITHGFDMKRPEQTIYRLASATDRFNQQLEMAERVSLHYQLPKPNERYTMIQTLAIRALALANDANEAAVSLSDQASGMQVRLASDGQVRVHALMGASGGGVAHTTLPPLPDDAPSSAATFYANTVASLPAGAASYAQEFASPQLTAMARAGAGSGEDAVCLFADDMADDPAVIYQRVAVMAKGAQAASTPTLVDMGEERDMLNLIRMREIQYERERSLRLVISSLYAL